MITLPQLKKISYTFILFLMTGCFGETDCPSFPDSKLNWIPYQLNNLIRYSDGTDTIEFTIVESYKSALYSFKNNCKCSCEANANFKTEINTEMDLKIEGYSNYYGERTNYEYLFIKHGFSGDYYGPLKSDYFYFNEENYDLTAVFIDELKIDDKTFQNVIEIEIDTIDDNSALWRKVDIWKILIADSIGLIQFEDCKTQKTWSIIE